MADWQPGANERDYNLWRILSRPRSSRIKKLDRSRVQSAAAAHLRAAAAVQRAYDAIVSRLLSENGIRAANCE